MRSGILLLDKPLLLSSQQAVSRAKRLLETRKAGHTGTLDPLATGMLPICFGDATKTATYILKAKKNYRAVVRLGARTATGDAEGEIVERTPVPHLVSDSIAAILQTFVGRIVQRPPIYSALKQQGVPLYELARKGMAVEASPREVDIHAIALLNYAEPDIELEVECGAGTYIRSLAVDIGQALGCAAYVASLHRAWVDPFDGHAMLNLNELAEIKQAGGLVAVHARCLPIAAGIMHLPAIRLDAEEGRRFVQGQTVGSAQQAGAGACRIYDAGGEFVGIGEKDEEGRIKPKRLVAQ